MWGDVLRWLAAKGAEGERHVRNALTHLEGIPLQFPPSTALSCLKAEPGVRLSAAKDYLSRIISMRCRSLEADVAATEVIEKRMF